MGHPHFWGYGIEGGYARAPTRSFMRQLLAISTADRFYREPPPGMNAWRRQRKNVWPHACVQPSLVKRELEDDAAAVTDATGNRAVQVAADFGGAIQVALRVCDQTLARIVPVRIP